MIIKRIEKEEIKNIDNKKEIIIKVDDTVQNYKIIDTYTYIDKQGEEVFVNERCLVDEDGYYYSKHAVLGHKRLIVIDPDRWKTANDCEI